MNTTESKSFSRHSHFFNPGNPAAEVGTLRVVALTAAMMVVEIIAGICFHSMALLADGWHMGSHVLALGIALLAYVFARKNSGDQRFAFGTWKVEVLGGFSSALMLLVIALLMIVESSQRLLHPVSIEFNQAIGVAVLGLIVNLVSAFMLVGRSESEGHAHGHSHGHSHGHGGEDLNLKAAYMHVLADAMTSVLAIAALLAGKYFGCIWMDPVMGIVGAIVIIIWGKNLLQQTGNVLLDREMDHPVVAEIREIIDAEPETRMCDLHVWRVAHDKYACIVSVDAKHPLTPDEYRAKLSIHEELVHITVEVNPWR